MSETMTAEQVANEMWDHFGHIDWRYENAGGMLQATVYAPDVVKWCKAMGWELPDGTHRAIRSAQDAQGGADG